MDSEPAIASHHHTDVAPASVSVVLATHAQMHNDLNAYQQQTLNYFSYSRHAQPQWSANAAATSTPPRSGNTTTAVTSVVGSPQVAPPPSRSKTDAGRKHRRHHRRTSSSSSGSHVGGAAAGALSALQTPPPASHDDDDGGGRGGNDDDDDDSDQRRRASAVASEIDDSSDTDSAIGSTVSTDDDTIARYKAERLQAIMRLGAGGGGSSSIAPSDLLDIGSRDRFDSQNSSFHSSTMHGGRRSSGLGPHHHSGSGVPATSAASAWANGITTEMVEQLKALESFATTIGGAADPSRVAPLDRARIIRVLRCKKSLPEAKKACVRLGALIDRLGISLVTFDDVASILNARCMVVPEGQLANDGSNVLVVVARRVPLLGEPSMDASSIARAAIFLIESVLVANENWTIVIDADQVPLSRWQALSPALGAIKELVSGAYPVRVKSVAVYRLNKGSGPAALAAGVVLTALEMKLLSAKTRRRLKYVKDLNAVVDARALSASLTSLGFEPLV